VGFRALVVDVHCPHHVREEGSPPARWRDHRNECLTRLPRQRGRAWAGTRRVGYRLLWRHQALARPEQHGLTLQSIFDRLKGVGIAPDELTDWTRCFRLPFVVRDGDKPITLIPTSLDSEAQLEELICADIAMLDPGWLLIGRQVATNRDR
jgi:hypothetical protein